MITVATEDQARDLKRRIRELKASALKSREDGYEALRAAILMIAEADAALRELSEDEGETAVLAEPRHTMPRHAIIRIDGSAADFALSVIGLTTGGAGTADLIRTADEMGATFSTGSFHAAVHRLVERGWIAKSGRRGKGAPYQLTRSGAHEWNALVHRWIP